MCLQKPWWIKETVWCLLGRQHRYKNANTCVSVTLDIKRLSCWMQHIIYSQEKKRQPFPYPEGLPIRRLSFVQWFRSLAPQSRYPEPECYHCKQREKHRGLSHTVKCLCLYFIYFSFFFLFYQTFLRRKIWLVTLPLPADNRADASSWANNRRLLISPRWLWSLRKTREMMTAVWFHTA